MSESGDVTEAKTFAAGFAERGCEHQARCNPGETGEIGIRKRDGEQKTGENRQRIPAAEERADRKIFQWPQLASKFFKDKFSRGGIRRLRRLTPMKKKSAPICVICGQAC
jgi:hypothetical protein